MHHVATLDLSELFVANAKTELPKSGQLAFFICANHNRIEGKVLLVDSPTPFRMPKNLPATHLLATHEGYGTDWYGEQKTFPRWPIKFVPMPYDDYEAQDRIAQDAGGSGYSYNLDLSEYKQFFINGDKPWVWESMHRFAENLKSVPYSFDDRIAHLEELLLRTESTQPQDEKHAKQLSETADQECRSIEALRNKPAAFWAFTAEMNDLVKDHDHFESLTASDLDLVEKAIGRTAGWSYKTKTEGEFRPFYELASKGYLSAKELANETFVAMARGPSEVFRTLPKQVKEAVNARHLRPSTFTECSHRMFGIPISMQNAAEEHEDKYMLLSLFSDQMMSWMWGDVGVAQFWIFPSDLAEGNFDNVELTIEGG